MAGNTSATVMVHLKDATLIRCERLIGNNVDTNMLTLSADVSVIADAPELLRMAEAIQTHLVQKTPGPMHEAPDLVHEPDAAEAERFRLELERDARGDGND